MWVLILIRKSIMCVLYGICMFGACFYNVQINCVCCTMYACLVPVFTTCLHLGEVTVNLCYVSIY